MTATADPPVSSEGGEPDGDEMTLWEHLGELRSRLVKAALGFAAFFIVGFVFNEVISDILTGPYCSLDPELRVRIKDYEVCQLIFTDVLGGFTVRIKAAMVVAITFGAPIICYQFWAFIVPGLKATEKRYAAPFVILTQLLFLSGAAFSLFIIPRGLEFLLVISGDRYVPLLDANAYLTFILRTMTAFGIAFEYPLVIAILVLMGITSHAWLKEYRRHAFFAAFVAAAVITPSTDPFTMSVMALPLAGFYEICIVFAKFIERGRNKAAGGSPA